MQRVQFHDREHASGLLWQPKDILVYMVYIWRSVGVKGCPGTCGDPAPVSILTAGETPWPTYRSPPEPSAVTLSSHASLWNNMARRCQGTQAKTEDLALIINLKSQVDMELSHFFDRVLEQSGVSLWLLEEPGGTHNFSRVQMHMIQAKTKANVGLCWKKPFLYHFNQANECSQTVRGVTSDPCWAPDGVTWHVPWKRAINISLTLF